MKNNLPKDKSKGFETKAQKDKRHETFMDLFYEFDSIHDGCVWMAEVTGVKKATIIQWRHRSHGRYTIPLSQYQKIMDKFKTRTESN